MDPQILDVDDWNKLVNDMRTLAERYGLDNTREALEYVEKRGFPQRSADASPV
jgi:hypothetical protein